MKEHGSGFGEWIQNQHPEDRLWQPPEQSSWMFLYRSYGNHNHIPQLGQRNSTRPRAHRQTMAGPVKQNAKIVISPSGFKAHFMDRSSQKCSMKEGSKIVDTGRRSLYCNTPLESCHSYQHLKIPGCLPGRKPEHIMSISNSVPFLHSNIYSHYALVNVNPSFTNEETDIQNVNYSLYG